MDCESAIAAVVSGRGKGRKMSTNACWLLALPGILLALLLVG